MADSCGRCGHVHSPDWAVAVHRFTPGGPAGYRASGAPGAPLRPTRDQAIADQCAHYAKTKQSTEGKPLS